MAYLLLGRHIAKVSNLFPCEKAQGLIRSVPWSEHTGGCHWEGRAQNSIKKA